MACVKIFCWNKMRSFIKLIGLKINMKYIKIRFYKNKLHHPYLLEIYNHFKVRVENQNVMTGKRAFVH